ncbi:DUF4342 domain-containing protein [Sedimentibacter sp. zth1]|uniref:DUF4342 domain-containing protein n=1 Tax=Sedimentibacter sp. zth1 TaxID=2816908 RepID=UPI001A920C1F|nr:DUF4342 domain-containing protein [Sedimentibacter sp. zth1]QSX06834.1 DUF4342 domain-containing protein [Sedimentibacter sp. zth1]
MDKILEKIDEVVKRTNVSYREAKEALENSNNDVLEAVIYIEENLKFCKCEANAKKKGEQIINEIKKVVEKGNVTKITIKRKNEIVLNIPITAGAVGIILAPFLTLAGLTAALLTECTIEIQKDNGEIIYVNDEVNKGVNTIKDEFNCIKKHYKKN